MQTGRKLFKALEEAAVSEAQRERPKAAVERRKQAVRGGLAGHGRLQLGLWLQP